MKLKQKIICYSYIVITPILLIISMFLFARNYSKMTNEQNLLGVNQAQNLGNSLEEMNQNVRELATYICINSDISKILNTQDVDRLNANPQLWLDNAPMRFIQDTMAIKGYIKTLGIYPENGVHPYLRCMDSSSYLPTLEEVSRTQMYQEAVDAKGKVCWKYVSKSSIEVYRANREEKLVLYREILDLSKQKRLGYLVIGADIQKYRELCENALSHKNDGVLILNAQGEELADGGEIDDSTRKYLKGESFQKKYLGKGSTYFSHGKQMIYLQQSEENAFITCIVIPKSNITDQLLSVAYTPLLLLPGVLIGLFPVLSLVSNVVTKPLGRVEQAMEKFREGDFEQQVEVTTKDEVGKMAECFNQMVTDIKLLIDENYVMELKEKESELMALQAQINPHFLYNTLDSLYWQAVEEGNEEIAENILALSNLFRLVLGEGKGIISVEQEMRLNEEYLKVQKMRFTKRLDYQIDLDPAIAEEKIPKLILQPFVENAVVHGFENTDSPCEIYVGGHATEKGMEFIIRDTGIGMTEEQVQAIFQEPKGEDAERYRGQRIGRYAIKNVKERLELRYRDRFELKVHSKPGRGTEIVIRIEQE